MILNNNVKMSVNNAFNQQDFTPYEYTLFIWIDKERINDIDHIKAYIHRKLRIDSKYINVDELESYILITVFRDKLRTIYPANGYYLVEYLKKNIN